MESELTFRIVLEKPPAGVDFGLQKGAGRDYETIQKQRSTGKDLNFDVNVRIKKILLIQIPFFLVHLYMAHPGIDLST
jgi:hypothetical protein